MTQFATSPILRRQGVCLLSFGFSSVVYDVSSAYRGRSPKFNRGTTRIGTGKRCGESSTDMDVHRTNPATLPTMFLACDVIRHARPDVAATAETMDVHVRRRATLKHGFNQEPRATRHTPDRVPHPLSQLVTASLCDPHEAEFA